MSSFSRFLLTTLVMKVFPFAIASALALGIALPAQAEPCQAYTVDHNRPYGYGFDEINNCPVMNGTFSNANWQVEISGWELGAYRYRGVNLGNGDEITLFDFDVAGTTDRPQYRFNNGDTLYTVSFQPRDPSTIRLEVYQGNRQILNQLLYR